MKKILTIIVFFALTNPFVMAQKVKHKEKEDDKIESARIAYITEQLGLTPEQAEKFWPLYREYNNKKLEIRDEFKQAKRRMKEGELSEAETQELLDLGTKLKEKELNVDKDYTERFQRVITNRQVLELRRAEDDFKKILLRRVEHRKGYLEGEERAKDRLEKRNNN